jgi:Mg-chelatase subunit ChlD
VAQWVPPARETSEITASINVECVPELPEVSVDGQSTFHAVVSLFSTESASGQAARTETARPPMDLVCVLDTSGSMGSDNKLVNLKHAGERKHIWL